jgi:acyl-coenzyme A synthetase/AMP-(fatty) acid ligase
MVFGSYCVSAEWDLDISVERQISINVNLYVCHRFRAIRKEDPEGVYRKKYDLSCLKSVFLAGERLDPATFDWLQEILPGVNIVDNWWQTESGAPMIANPTGLQVIFLHYKYISIPTPCCYKGPHDML